MPGKLTSVLLSWPLLLALATLITNDLYLKYTYPGLVTGKLSDFAGIFLVSCLAFSLLPRWRLASAVTIVLLFCWWKSPLSQPLIDAVNSVAPVRIGRVVDYWDLTAFAIMPLALIAVRRAVARTDRSRRRAMTAVPVAIVALLAMTGTSVLTPTSAFRIRGTDADHVVDEGEVTAVVKRVAQSYGAECESDETMTAAMDCRSRDIWILYLFDETTSSAQFLVQVQRQKGFLLPEPDYQLMDRVMHDLKREFARMAPKLEYVEALDDYPHQQVFEFIEQVCNENPNCE